MDTASKATGGVMERMIVLMDLMSNDAVSIETVHLKSEKNVQSQRYSYFFPQWDRDLT